MAGGHQQLRLRAPAMALLLCALLATKLAFAADAGASNPQVDGNPALVTLSSLPLAAAHHGAAQHRVLQQGPGFLTPPAPEESSEESSGEGSSEESSGEGSNEESSGEESSFSGDDGNGNSGTARKLLMRGM